jgi:hypothetical protein
MSTHVYRVIVRGRIDALDDEQRDELRAEAPDHEALRAAFTREGTLTYDDRLDFFSFRYEVRVRSDDGSDPTEKAFDQAVARAASFLDGRGIAYRYLKPTGTDLTRIWDDPA